VALLEMERSCAYRTSRTRYVAILQSGISFAVLQIKVSASGRFDVPLTKIVLIVPAIFLPNFSTGGIFTAASARARMRMNKSAGNPSNPLERD
jgi:hypothetical protein